MRVLPTVALYVALAGGLYHPAAKADLVGISNSGTIYSIDPASAAAAVLVNNDPALNGANALGRDGAGVFYTAVGASLRSLSPNNLAVAPTSLALNFQGTAVNITGLAGGPAGTLYAINDGGLGNPDQLWRINLATGVGNLVGATGRSSLQGLAANSAGELYGWDIQSGLQRLNSATGAATGFATPVPQGLSIQALAFDASDNLYGAESALYSISLTTGAATLIVPSPNAGAFGNVRGIEFRAGSQVPEPGSLSLLIAMLFAWRRIRR